jgi:hypothetical protein
LQSIENKGEAATVRFSSQPESDREQLYAKLKRQHETEIHLLKIEYEAKLLGYENRIADLKDVFRLETQRPIHVSHQEAKLVSNPQNFNQSPISVSGQGNVLNLGEISGQVSTVIRQLPEAPPGQPDLKALLAQLQSLIEHSQELSPEDKASALKKVAEIAEAGKSPGAGKSAAKEVLRFFKGLIGDMQAAGSFIAELTALVGKIGGWFGL